MEKYDVIDEGIQEGNIFLLREAIGNLCYLSRDFSNGKFDYYMEYIKEKGIEIKEDGLKGQLVSEGKTEYTEEDFENAVFELKENFCDERINDVKKIGMSVYGKPKQPSIQKTKSPGTVPKDPSHQKSGERINKVVFLVAVLIVLAIIYLIKKM